MGSVDDRRAGSCRNLSEDGVIAGGDGQPREEPLAGKTACYITDQSDNFGGTFGLATVNTRDLRQPFTKDLALAGCIATTETTYRHPSLHGHSLPGKIQ